MSISVLICDDHAIIRDGLKLLLESQPDIVVTGEAMNGRDAIIQAKKLRPDIVIMDIAMPGLNGIEAADRILQECRSTRIIILSMYSTTEHIYRSLKVGARGYLLKESAGAEVIAAIKAVYNGMRYLSQKISDRVIEDYLNTQAAKEPENPLERLTRREREILQMVSEGKSSVEIAGIMFLSPKTVETYRSRLMHKLGVNDIPALVKFAIRYGLTQLE
ncbi:MAG: response regulator transcription factor [Syntrophorhabdaceae bacterium]|nr:response regulator transcription factor [Syntrophorhabdaceae bacterium]MDD4196230.1 response regulator transcription factor [Syntrophorhabdaceae bacterium]HOC45773.1 response regulator transcription factor [Syntrophorhabdaceae bacterium]